MISIKTSEQIIALRESGEILKQTLKLLQDNAKVGMSTKELNDMAHNYIKSCGAIASCLGYEGYPEAICTSINNEVVHGIPSKNRILKDGDIVKCDICVTYHGMVTDAARTIPVGNVSSEVMKLIEVTKESFFRGIKDIKAGSRVGDIGHQVQEYAESFGYGVVRDLTGHGVGNSVHEDPSIPNYGRAGTGPRLYENMCIAVEPMINLGTFEVDFSETDDWTVTTSDGKPSSHYENTLLITKDGVEVITL